MLLCFSGPYIYASLQVASLLLGSVYLRIPTSCFFASRVRIFTAGDFVYPTPAQALFRRLPELFLLFRQLSSSATSSTLHPPSSPPRTALHRLAGLTDLDRLLNSLPRRLVQTVPALGPPLPAHAPPPSPAPDRPAVAALPARPHIQGAHHNGRYTDTSAIITKQGVVLLGLGPRRRHVYSGGRPPHTDPQPHATTPPPSKLHSTQPHASSQARTHVQIHKDRLRAGSCAMPTSCRWGRVRWVCVWGGGRSAIGSADTQGRPQAPAALSWRSPSLPWEADLGPVPAARRAVEAACRQRAHSSLKTKPSKPPAVKGPTVHSQLSRRSLLPPGKPSPQIAKRFRLQNSDGECSCASAWRYRLPESATAAVLSTGGPPPTKARGGGSASICIA